MIVHRQQQRRGFTLIEMMVAMSLTVFVMTVLSDAFVKGLTTFSGLKSVGDLQENLRVVTSNLRADLAQDHFEGKRRLSDANFWTDKPRNGFFAFQQQPRPTWDQRTVDGIISIRGTDVLHFTVKRRGNRPETLFSTVVPNGPNNGAFPEISPLLVPPVSPATTASAFRPTDIYGSPDDATFRSVPNYTSHWAEVAYFLIRTGTTVDMVDTTTADSVGIVPLYQLYRAELLVVPDKSQVDNQPGTVDNVAGAPANHRKIACKPAGSNLAFATPADLVTIGNRTLDIIGTPAFTKNPTDAKVIAAKNRAGLVMVDVISFQAQPIFYVPDLNVDVTPDEVTPPSPIFDSGAAATYQLVVSGTPHDAVLKGVIITIRGWDWSNHISRQVTVIQDL